MLRCRCIFVQYHCISPALRPSFQPQKLTTPVWGRGTTWFVNCISGLPLSYCMRETVLGDGGVSTLATSIRMPVFLNLIGRLALGLAPLRYLFPSDKPLTVAK